MNNKLSKREIEKIRLNDERMANLYQLNDEIKDNLINLDKKKD